MKVGPVGAFALANAFKEMQKNLAQEGWLLPALEANMRNQKNISTIDVQPYHFEMQETIPKLKCGSTAIGQVPILVRVKENDWNTIQSQVWEQIL